MTCHTTYKSRDRVRPAALVQRAEELTDGVLAIDQGQRSRNATINRIADPGCDAVADRTRVSVRQPDVIAIPKGSKLEHVRDNRGALEIHLSEQELLDLDREFPPPHRKVPLEMI
jgi:diketogulonate reductase-like aldo/keto reductase